MNTPLALIIGSALIAAGLYFGAPHYQLLPINSANAAAWKINLQTGDVTLCATAANEKGEAGCSVKLKQY